MNNIIIEKKWMIPSLPFVWGPLESSSNGVDLPDELPFSLGVNPETGCLIQRPNNLVRYALSIAYSKGSTLSGLMDDDGIGKGYADDFINFIEKSSQELKLDDLKVLEIGCGNGYLLKCLADKGADVLGIEPGDHAQIGSKKWGVPIIQDNFPSSTINEKFDLILTFAVLEHIENPVEFLSLIKNNLSDDGILIIAVPDEGPYINSGDVSTLFHEHWSYFDKNTLLSTVRLAGYMDLKCELSGYGGSIFCSMKKSDANFELSIDDVQSAKTLANDYIDQSRKHVETFNIYVNEIYSKGETLAIYVPGRAVNALSIGNTEIGTTRFIDDNPLLVNTYFPGFDIPIENRESLISRPTDNVIIMSRTFGDKLAMELKAQMPSHVDIITIDCLLSS